VACALVDEDNRVLIARRPEGRHMAGLWEFPGGKVDLGELPEQALIRELAEELGIDVTQSCLAPLTFASHGYEDFHLLMPLYVCRQWNGEVEAKEGQEIAWVRPNRLADYDMPPADEPKRETLRELLNNKKKPDEQEFKTMIIALEKAHAFVSDFVRDTSGTTAIEYAVIAAGIAMTIIATVNGVGSEVNSLFTSVQGKF